MAEPERSSRFPEVSNPNVAGTLTQTIDIVNGMLDVPALIIHTGDITHLSEPAEFDLAAQLLSRLRTSEIHTVPGEHDTAAATVTEYFSRFGKASDNRGYYSFDHAGVHFIGLINVFQFKPGGLGTLGDEQLAWVAADLKQRSAYIQGPEMFDASAEGRDDSRFFKTISIGVGTHPGQSFSINTWRLS